MIIKGHGIVAGIVALGFSVSIVILAYNELQHVGHVTAAESNLLSTTLGAAVGSVATYLGIRVDDPKDKDE